MYLKVDNDGQEQIYSFQNQKTVIIGRGPSSDIQVVTDGISRKHLEVREKDGEFFVVDFGSTNGTFQNDERLEPNVEHPFNSFFPLKLGFHVFLYLVDEISPEQLESAISDGIDESENKRRAEQKANRTRKVKASGTNSKINIGDKTNTGIRNTTKLSSEGTQTQRKVRTKRKSQKVEEESGDKLNLPLYIGVLFLILAGLAYSQGYLDSLLGNDRPVAPPVVNKPKVNKPKVVEKPKEKVVTRKELSAYMNVDKCLSDQEIPLCNELQKVIERDFNEGFAKVLDKTYLIVDFDKFVNGLINKLNFTQQDKQDVIVYGRKYFGRRFNQREMEENDYKTKTLVQDEAYALASLVFFLSLNNSLQSLESTQTSDLIFIPYNNQTGLNSPYLYINVNLDQLKRLANDQETVKLARLSLYSGLSTLFESHIKFNMKDIQEQLFKKVVLFKESSNTQ